MHFSCNMHSKDVAALTTLVILMLVSRLTVEVEQGRSHSGIVWRVIVANEVDSHKWHKARQELGVASKHNEECGNILVPCALHNSMWCSNTQHVLHCALMDIKAVSGNG